MARSKTSSFITEIPLIVDSQQEKELLSRFQAGRQLYNACLNEAEVRMNLVRNSEAYQEAKKIPITQKKKRTEAFAVARQAYRFSEYELHAFATITSNNSKWIAKKIDSNTQQAIATRAFKAVEKVLFGKAKKVRYKVPSRFRSLEGKTNFQGIRWKEDQFVWCDLVIKPLIDWMNPVILHGLNSRIKYVRILWREINGVRRWYAQLVNEGIPFQKPKNYIYDGVVGIDLNISNIAFVADSEAGLLPNACGVPTFEKEIKTLQRQMDRSRRANNPDNYHPDFEGKKGRKTIRKKGTSKKGRRKWNNSKRYLKLSQNRRELERRKTTYAKSQNRKIVNEILRHGKHIKTENVSVKGWQKRYGKAIAAKSPSFVQSELKRKAENAGGSFTKFSTQKTALSQIHLSGNRIKKTLSQRVHHDETGIVMHRDLFSAYLSRYVNDDVLSLQDAVEQYPGAEPFLEEAWKRYQQTAKRVGESESGQCHSPLERFSQKLGTVNQIAIDGRKFNFNS
ncbi:transposase [Microseira wollei]|uniref:Transposase, IS608 family protein n=1 Tax=Microseira wollei NIES-4236 TaxID=2530354 RepID=A0AAV3XEC0_9CYAN|nr:transposase [Microseira wollei]GET40235.1 transposase, IS608 family protein [Microseira wollei NIES-4236]